MSHAAFPSAAEVQTALSNAGYSLPVGTSGAGYAAQAKTAWESLCGYPFLGTGTPGDVLYDATCSEFLHFGRWYSSVTAVAVGVSEADTTGTVLDIGNSVFLAKNRDSKVYGLRFPSAIFGAQESIKVTGLSGWDSTVPDDVFDAVLTYAVGLAINDLRSQNGVVTACEQPGSKTQYAESVVPTEFLRGLRNNLKTAANAYRQPQLS